MTSSTGFNIQDFKSNIGKDGVLQNNKFLVTISNPQQFVNVGLLQFRASDIRIPGVSFETLNTHRYGVGPIQKFPTNVNFTDIGITFIEDKHGSIWNSMNSWTRKIFNYGGVNTVDGISPSSVFYQEQYTLEYKNTYSTNIVIQVFNNEAENDTYIGALGSDIKATLIITLLDAYPISMHDVPLSWSDNNNLFKTTVDFTFRDYNIV
jgi:hypothetical protein